jgi:hypothetical protein
MVVATRKKYLSSVEESPHDEFPCNCINIHIRADNASIIPTAREKSMPNRKKFGSTYSSSVTLFIVPVQACTTFFPVAVDPVNEILLTSG